MDSWRNLVQGSNNVSIEQLWTSAEVGSNKIHKQGELTSNRVGKSTRIGYQAGLLNKIENTSINEVTKTPIKTGR
jgi:hypothetical protein